MSVFARASLGPALRSGCGRVDHRVGQNRAGTQSESGTPGSPDPGGQTLPSAA